MIAVQKLIDSLIDIFDQSNIYHISDLVSTSGFIRPNIAFVVSDLLFGVFYVDSKPLYEINVLIDNIIDEGIIPLIVTREDLNEENTLINFIKDLIMNINSPFKNNGISSNNILDNSLAIEYFNNISPIKLDEKYNYISLGVINSVTKEIVSAIIFDYNEDDKFATVIANSCGFDTDFFIEYFLSKYEVVELYFKFSGFCSIPLFSILDYNFEHVYSVSDTNNRPIRIYSHDTHRIVNKKDIDLFNIENKAYIINSIIDFTYINYQTSLILVDLSYKKLNAKIDDLATILVMKTNIGLMYFYLKIFGFRANRSDIIFDNSHIEYLYKKSERKAKKITVL